MDILTLLVVLAIIGLLLYVIVKLVPMPEPYRTAIIALITLLVIIWVIRQLGIALPRL